mgnify:CR=1 FL=1
MNEWMNEWMKFLSYFSEEATGGVNYHGIMSKYKFWLVLQVDAMCVYVLCTTGPQGAQGTQGAQGAQGDVPV